MGTIVCGSIVWCSQTLYQIAKAEERYGYMALPNFVLVYFPNSGSSQLKYLRSRICPATGCKAAALDSSAFCQSTFGEVEGYYPFCSRSGCCFFSKTSYRKTLCYLYSSIISISWKTHREIFSDHCKANNSYHGRHYIQQYIIASLNLRGFDHVDRKGTVVKFLRDKGVAMMSTIVTSAFFPSVFLSLFFSFLSHFFHFLSHHFSFIFSFPSFSSFLSHLFFVSHLFLCYIFFLLHLFSFLIFFVFAFLYFSFFFLFFSFPCFF